MHERRLCLLGVLSGIVIGAVLAPLAGVDAKDGPPATAGVNAYFSPGGGIETAIAEVMKGAKQEIVVAMFNFTSRPLADGLAAAQRRGVNVRVIIDASQAFQKYSRLSDLRRAKVAVRLMKLPKTADDQQIRFHHKFMVVDGETITTGSHNWTSQADESNWENEVILQSKKIAVEFKEEFEKAWGKAEDDTIKKSGASGAGSGEEKD
jgi:phosphatidylserine/phosphatidylglycerophosphate/cardiolipin synthase-like enzyme